MFEEFQHHFPLDHGHVIESRGAAVKSDVSGFSEVVGRFGGASFGRGLYRVIRAGDVDKWNARVSLGFPEFAGRITCFGYDWLGRAFAVDTQRLEGGQPGVVMFEPGTGDAFDIPSNLHLPRRRGDQVRRRSTRCRLASKMAGQRGSGARLYTMRGVPEAAVPQRGGRA
jgi:hypothetical protein